jgi:hypothetical protein
MIAVETAILVGVIVLLVHAIGDNRTEVRSEVRQVRSEMGELRSALRAATKR